MTTATLRKVKRNRHQHTFLHPWHSLKELHAETLSKVELLGWIETMSHSGTQDAMKYKKVFEFLVKNEKAGNGRRHHVHELVLLMREIRADIEAGMTLHVKNRLSEAVNRANVRQDSNSTIKKDRSIAED